jgi:hypothetical protein
MIVSGSDEAPELFVPRTEMEHLVRTPSSADYRQICRMRDIFGTVGS